MILFDYRRLLRRLLVVILALSLVVNGGMIGLSLLPSSASASTLNPPRGVGSGSWNPNVPCSTPWIVKISDLTNNMTETNSYNTSPYSPGITENPPITGSEGAKRWLTPGSTPPGWVSPGPGCTITNLQGQTVGAFVEIDGIGRTTMVYETDCATNFDAADGGTAMPAGHWCDNTLSLFDPAVVPNSFTACSTPSDPTCYGKMHVEFDKDWMAAGYCGTSTSFCNNSTLNQLTVAGSPKSLIDIQGFVFWDPAHITEQWHSFNGWELHPITAWRLHQSSSSSPDFGLSASPTSLSTTSGSTASSTITVFSQGSFTGTINLSSSVSPPGPTVSFNPASMKISAGGSATSTLSFQSANAGNYTVTVSGTNGTVTHQVLLHVNVRQVPDFLIAFKPDSLSEIPGTSASTTITLTSLNGFSGQVSLSGAVSAGGFNVQINPNNPTLSIGGTATSTLTVTSPNNAAPVNYSVSLTGKGGSVTHTVVIPLAITSFVLTVNPGDASFPAGGSGNLNVTLASVNGFTGNVSLALQVSNNQLRASLGSTTLNLGPGGVAVTTLSLASSANGGYTTTVTGTSGRISSKISATVDVGNGPDFIVSANPTILTIPTGSSGSLTVTTASINGLSGTVNLKANVNPNGPQLTLNPASFRINAGASASSTLTITIPANTHLGLYSISVTAQSGPTHAVTVWLYVAKADFSLSSSPVSQTVTAGGSASYQIALASVNSFSGSVTLSASSPSSIASSFNPTIVAMTAGGSATSNLTITTTPSTSPGSFTVSVTGTSGSIIHTITVVIVVNGLPDFSLTVTPTSVRVLATAFGNVTVGLINSNGFNGTVNLSTTVSPPTNLNCQLSTSAILGSQTANLSCKGSIGSYKVTVTGTSGTLQHTVNVTYTVQDFAISAKPTSVSVPADQAGNSTITVSSLQGFTGIVSLNSNSTACSFAPINVTSPGSSNLSCTFSSPGIVHVVIVGTSASLAHTVTVTYAVGGAQDFSISAAPASITAPANSQGTSTITVSSINGFAGTITLTSSVSPTSGLSCSLNPSSISLGASGTSTLSCAGTVGSYNVTVSGTNGALTHSTTVSYAVEDYTVSADPTSVNASASSAGTSTISVVAENGFGGTVSLTADNTACTLGPTSINGSGNATLSCTFSSPGTFQVTVTGSSGPLSHSATVTYNVGSPPVFIVSANPTSVTIFAGDNGSSTITVQGSGGFVGTVTLSDAVSPSSGLACTLSPTSVTLVGTITSGTSTLTCTGSSNFYIVTVTGTSGNATASTSITFIVQDFQLTPSPSSIVFPAGGSGSSTITVTSLQGFTGTVNLSTSVSSSSITATLNPTTVTGSGSSTLQVLGSTTGSYSVTITGTSGSLTHSITLTVTVGGAQDFQISANPPSTILYQGGSNSSILTITPINGFSANVTLSATSPTGFTVQFSSNPVTAGSNNQLTISVATSVTAGTYTITVTGTSGSLVHSINMSINVRAKPSIAFVAATPVAGGSSTIATTGTIPFQKGDLVVVYVSVGNGQTVSSIIDSGSTSSSYALTSSAVNGNTILYLYTATAATSSNNTITVTISSAGYLQISAAEYSGVVGFGALNTATGTSTTPSVSLTTQSSNSWVVVAYGWTGSGTHSADVGFNDRHAGSIGTQHLDCGDTNGPKATGTYSYSGTLSLSNPWAMIALELV